VVLDRINIFLLFNSSTWSLSITFYQLSSFFIGCKSVQNSNTSLTIVKPKGELSQIAQWPWYHKDYLQDGVPGISLDKCYSQSKQGKRQNIIVAIDTQIDLNHEDTGTIMMFSRKLHNEIDGLTIMAIEVVDFKNAQRHQLSLSR
jgi:hypothetical protein